MEKTKKIRKIWSYLLILCMIITFPVQPLRAELVPTGANLIQDPGLENTSELIKDGAPWDNNTGIASIETDPLHVNSGNHAIKFTGAYAYAKQANIPVEIGATYRLSAYTKTASTKNINLQVLIPGATTLKDSAGNTSYTKQELEFTATTDTITVELYTSGSSTFAWADDFELVKLVSSGPADTDAPTVPTELAASDITDISVKLSWGASSDNVGVTGYIIYADGTEKQTVNMAPVTTPAIITANVTGLAQLTSYNFTVKAKDAGGNLSDASDPVLVTTLETPEPGEQPTSLILDGGFETIPSITSTSTPWYTDATQAHRAYSIVTNEKFNGNKALHFAEAWCWVEQKVDVEPNTLYSVSMRVKSESTQDGVFRFGIRDGVDSSRWLLPNSLNNINKSTNGWILMENMFVTSNTDTMVRFAMFQRQNGKIWIDDIIINKIEDTTPPTAPNNLSSSDVKNSSIRLSWELSTDDNGVAGYEVYKGEELITTVAGDVTTFLVAGLDVATEYTFKVRARDVAQKFSDFSNALTVTTTNAETQYFKVLGSKILDPEGNEFKIKGANVMGYNAAWPVPEEPFSQLALFKTWGFNFARLYARIDMTYKTGGVDGHNRDLNKFYEIIDAYTAEDIVVMIELHDKTGSYYTDVSTPSLNELADFHAALAARYKHNPYVWFNVMNEPGGAGAVDPQWVTTNQSVIKAIRDTGNNSVIVSDGASWGQDVGEWNTNLVKEQNSAILTYGADLKNFGGQTYENIMFSIHAYDQWKFGDAKLIDFIDRVHAKGHALLIGEFGSWNNNYNFDSLDTTMRVAPEKGVGLVVWHWWGGDRNRLTVKIDGTNGGGQFINKTDGTKPTNLTYLGNLVWDYNHDQLTAESFNHDLEKDPDPVIILPKPEKRLINDFENFESNEALAEEWIHPGHGGTVLLSLDTENKNSGSYSMKVDYTTSSTHAGRRKVINQDWSDYEGISFWIKPDGSGRRLVVQLQIGTIAWEFDHILLGTEPQLVQIPFDAFLHPNNMGGDPDVSKVSLLNLYINNNFRDGSIPAIERGSGILYFDDILLMGGPADPVAPGDGGTTIPTTPGDGGTTTPTTPGDGGTTTPTTPGGGGGGSTAPTAPTAPTVPTAPTEPGRVATISLVNGVASVGEGSVSLYVQPYIKNGRTMIGLRDLATLINIASKNIIWDGKNKSILIKTADKEVKLVIGQKYALVNGEKIVMDVAPEIKDGRTVLPMAHIARILGAKVEFNHNTKEITLVIE